ncbi:LysM peptidoglycan-binding domain-containing protein [Pseudohoeflea suaedae]|uniref:LysM peptidoglycan-binding domain-containing protein n=1 Tax=Pseudohoeflea suaedae TaxID=877384 RepID=A0A4R5PJP9_9HYPH|nr:LysM peptidoglycan-binding domain-containing protein [Pseudohoeflea suaedae]TDH35909.1 LysM peptidoglycan-binding domain-containing protein [Pseudohoeflea suaedae]
MLNGKITYFAVIALVVVLGIAGYFGVPRLLHLGKPAAVTDMVPAGGQDANSDTETAAGESASGDAEVAAADPEADPADKTEEPVVPAFDLVRVEPDGSMVIAGTAAPGGAVDVVSGEDTVVSADVGTVGDFVAILDKPLAPGDYQLQLRSIAPNGSRTLSEEIATISIPRGEAGQLLAMVDKPGEASRILTQPKPKEAAPEEVASADPNVSVKPDAGMQVEERQAEAQDGDEPAAGDAAGPAQSSSEEVATADAPEAGMPAMASGSDDIAASAPDVQGEAGQKEAGKAAGGDAAQTETAALDPAATASETPQDNAPKADGAVSIRVDAVEIEDGTVYVAGSATPGVNIRVLADENPIGSTRSGSGGRFIVEAKTELSVGNHMIAAEIVGAGGEVAMRAVVPFNRPAGNRIAAVAKAPGAETSGAGQASAEQPDPAAATGETGAGEPTGSETAGNTVEQDALTPAAGSVIIRKGDTLWQISRRTYGQGVRYTTIYLANQQQILDPNRISPGQVFNLPEKWDEDAEKTHHDLMEKRSHSTN